jgi:hypothetical protein
MGVALLVLAGASEEVRALHNSSITISAAPPAEPWTRWANVTVTWTAPAIANGADGVAPDGDADWIGAFLLDWPATYIKWQPASGNGTAVFRLLNGRHAYVFRYFRGDALLAESNAVEPLGRTPLQGHLSLVPGRNSSSSGGGAMAIVWVSNSSEPQAVRWGTSPSALDMATTDVSTDTIASREFTDCMGVPPAPARTTPFASIGTHDNRCGHDCYGDTTAPELYLDPGFIHSAVMEPLPPPGTPTCVARCCCKRELLRCVFTKIIIIIMRASISARIVSSSAVHAQLCQCWSGPVLKRKPTEDPWTYTLLHHSCELLSGTTRSGTRQRSSACTATTKNTINATMAMPMMRQWLARL